jgi:hypothetical protein
LKTLQRRRQQNHFKAQICFLSVELSAKLAQQPTLRQGRTFRDYLTGFASFKVGLSYQYPEPIFHKEKSIAYPGIELSTFGIAVDYVNHCTI